MRRGGNAGGPHHRSIPRLPPSSPYNPSVDRRDSGSSFASSRPSSAGGRPLPPSASALLSDRSSQSSALRAINSYLSSLSAPFSLRPPLPSARDITDCFRLLLSRLDFPDPGQHLVDQLLAILKSLSCPIKLTRSALRAPGTPHSWPALVSVLYWLVQLALCADHQLTSSPPRRPPNDILLYTAQSYSFFISGQDDAVEELDQQYVADMERETAAAAASADALAKEAAELEEKVKDLRSRPSRKEELERQRDELLDDNRKFESVVENYKEKVAAMEGKLKDYEKELDAKVMESRRIREENEELERRIKGQAVNARDVERMRRELQAVEREIGESENMRNVMEEKAWEIEAAIGKKAKEFEVMAEQGNQLIRK